MVDVHVWPDDMDEARARVLRVVSARLGGEPAFTGEVNAVMNEILALDAGARMVAISALIESFSLLGQVMASITAAEIGVDPLDALRIFDKQVGVKLDEWRREHDAG